MNYLFFRLKNCSLLLLALVLYLPFESKADWFFNVVMLSCEPAKDQLVIDYVGAFNEEGERLLKLRTKDIWDPWHLIHTDQSGDHILREDTVKKACHLSTGVHQIEIGPLPGNANIQGHCGAAMSAWVRIFRGRSMLVDTAFEGACDSKDPVITRITVKGGSASPIIHKVSNQEFMDMDLSEFYSGLDRVDYRCRRNGGDCVNLWEYAIAGKDKEALNLLTAEANRTGYWGGALIASVQARRDDLLERFLDAGANPNQRPNFKTPLQLAVCKGTKVAVSLLLKHGAQDSIGDFGEDAYTEAVTCGDMGSIHLLLDANQKVDVRSIPEMIRNAPESSLIATIPLLFDRGAIDKASQIESIRELAGRYRKYDFLKLLDRQYLSPK